MVPKKSIQVREIPSAEKGMPVYWCAKTEAGKIHLYKYKDGVRLPVGDWRVVYPDGTEEIKNQIAFTGDMKIELEKAQAFGKHHGLGI